MHDLSVLFDDDGKIYAISGGRNPYPIVELSRDLTAVIPDARHPMNAPGMGEGHHLYKIKGKYYDISAIPGGNTDQMIARADSIDGPWVVRRMVQAECLGVPGQAPLRPNRRPSGPDDRGLTLHQGGMVDTPSGEWWSIIMQDHGSIGRLVALVPISWENEFPIIGLPGNLRKAPNTWIKPNAGPADRRPAFVHDDDFEGGKLNPLWQWNHVPDDTRWSLTEKPGVLRLHSLPADDFYSARNTICQRPPGPESIMTVEMDGSGLAPGDTAGLALLSNPYAWIGLVKTAEGTTLKQYDGTHRVTATAPTCPAHLWLRVACNFDTDQAIFSWSAGGKGFTPLGDPFTMTFQLRTFQGVRPSLFNFNASGQPGGYADFDDFTVEEPRASGLERTIPLGKTITLASGADSSFLAAGAQDRLVNVAASAPDGAPRSARFRVVDAGMGRVALEAESGRFVSAGSDGVALKDLAGKAPGPAESFQWVNLMRGDTMLLSLANHRYLTTRTNDPGPVTVSATGPSPDRNEGACFKWKAVE
jgi:beta-xylosidase